MDNVAAETLTIQVGASLREVEKRVIEATLCHFHGNLSRAAKILGINRTTLYAKIKEYKLERGKVVAVSEVIQPRTRRRK